MNSQETNKERRVNDEQRWAHVDNRLTDQDKTLHGIAVKLDSHIIATKDLKDKVTPVVDAMEAMQGGIRVIGWLGSKVAAIGVAVAAIFGALTAWHNWK
jgi:hypothetical protein